MNRSPTPRKLPALRVIDALALPSTPWRNGGGATRELYLRRESTAAEAWTLRVSLADIERDGPFSAFPGMERWFAVLEGAGVCLSWPGGSRLLGPDAEPWAFDGALAPSCAMRDGPTRDLNLICLRAAGRGTMLRASSGLPWVCDAPWRAVFTAEAASLEIDGRFEAELAPMSLAVMEASAAQPWALHGAAPLRACWLAFFPASTSPGVQRPGPEGDRAAA